MTRTVLILSMLVLASCGPTYTGGAGVGFDDGYNPYRAAREAELAGRNGTPAPLGPDGPGGQVISGDDLAAAGIGSAGTAGSTFQTGTTLPPGAAPQAAQPGGNVGISDEQDFGAVASRETIRSDAERLEAQREAYQVIQPEPIPERPRDTGPNIVAFALSTSNQPGEQIYSRTGFNSQSRFQRNCAKYSGSDQAQQAFLENGGPQRDRLGLDPDGDGFACYWDPRPFRAARQG
jgi:hypothetical protein